MATTVKSVTGRKSSSTNKMRVRLAWESRASKPSSPCSTASLPNPITVSTHTPHLLTWRRQTKHRPLSHPGGTARHPRAPFRLLFFGGLGFVGFFEALLGVAWAANQASVSIPSHSPRSRGCRPARSRRSRISAKNEACQKGVQPLVTAAITSHSCTSALKLVLYHELKELKSIALAALLAPW